MNRSTVFGLNDLPDGVWQIGLALKMPDGVWQIGPALKMPDGVWQIERLCCIFFLLSDIFPKKPQHDPRVGN